jgi:hypothetical protein
MSKPGERSRLGLLRDRVFPFFALSKNTTFFYFAKSVARFFSYFLGKQAVALIEGFIITIILTQ